MPYRHTSTHFCCELRAAQCAWAAGCRRRVTIGLPHCWQHSKLVYGVKTAPSTIPGGGKGLFATRDFAKGERICPYGGALLTAREIDDRYPGDTLAPYAVKVFHDAYRDAACDRGIGSMANGMRWKRDCNAELFATKGKVLWLRAIRAIRTGDEILNHYQSDYFADDDLHTTITQYVRPRRR